MFVSQSNYNYDTMFVLLEAGAYLDKGKIDTKALFFKAVDKGRAHVLLGTLGVDMSMQNKRRHGL